MPAQLQAPGSPSQEGQRRQAILKELLDPDRLPSPPAIALQVVNATSRPDCDPAKIVALLGQDPALYGKLLKAVNSCLYGLAQPVSTVARAVAMLGLNTVRSLALGLSLPEVRIGSGVDAKMSDYWVSSVGGALIARELAILTRCPNPEDSLVAGLLRDLGELLLRQTYPKEWDDHVTRHGSRLVEDPCGAEEESFGIHHAEVSAELLRGWNLPAEIVEPIRYHHQPSELATKGQGWHSRAELLAFADHLIHLDVVSRNPELLNQVLTTARSRFGLARGALAKFLQGVAPKIGEFGRLIKQDIGACPDFAAILTAGATELVNLTLETSRNRLSGSISVAESKRQSAGHDPSSQGLPMLSWHSIGSPLPEFRPEHIERLPESGCQLGGYELRKLLGRGAMGVVFSAFELSLQREVAIKLLIPELAASPTARQRFLREARVAASIQHENVVTVYAVSEAVGLPYLAMEYVRGQCLETYLQKRGPLPLPELLSTSHQIASGLAAAHERGIVHRDMKPANILIAKSGRVKITDFGLARVADDTKLTAEGSLVGTPYFMAPEILDCQPATPLTDLFSLGGVLYALATGSPPFPGPSIAAVFRAVSDLAPKPPRQLRPELPDWFEKVILRLLEKSPTNRYPTATEVVAALRGRRSEARIPSR